MLMYPVGLKVYILVWVYNRCVYVSREGSDESGQMRRLAWAFVAWQCDKYQILKCWLVYVNDFLRPDSQMIANK